MSYDVRVWGRQLADWDAAVPEDEGWRQQGDSRVLEKRTWQITVGPAQRLEPEDVPSEVSEALPGPSVLVEVTLEPIGAPASARKTLARVARRVAGHVAGVVEDPQQDELTFPRGTKRLVKPRRAERLSVLSLSWWYVGSQLRNPGGTERLLSLVQQHLPEAVPRRYGPWEPPQDKTEETGLERLASFMREHLDSSPVYYPTRPAVGFSVSDCGMEQHARLGFRSNRIEIEIELDVLGQPGWERAVRNLWRGMSHFMSPFYGEARVLRNHVWMGATIGSDMETDVHPIRSWFWRGIPPELGVAVVLGEPYRSLWTPPGAQISQGLAFLEAEDWASAPELRTPVPPGIAQRWIPAWTALDTGGYCVKWCDEQPDVWPFA